MPLLSRPPLRPSEGPSPGSLALLGLLLILLFLWWWGWTLPGSDLAREWGARWGLADPSRTRVSPQTAQDLARIPVREKSGHTGYRREAFGQAWADVDHNGCDTRNDILRRDLVQVAYRPGQHCAVAQGRLADPYTGEEIPFRAGPRSRDVQIDHVVALSDAWSSGASAWEAGKRQQLANDPENLLAVDGPANQEKGDADAAHWLPPDRDFRCSYVARQVHVKGKYGLSMTSEERQAVLRVLGACPGFRLPPAGAPSAPAAGSGAR